MFVIFYFFFHVSVSRCISWWVGRESALYRWVLEIVDDKKSRRDDRHRADGPAYYRDKQPRLHLMTAKDNDNDMLLTLKTLMDKTRARSDAGEHKPTVLDDDDSSDTDTDTDSDGDGDGDDGGDGDGDGKRANGGVGSGSGDGGRGAAGAGAGAAELHYLVL